MRFNPACKGLIGGALSREHAYRALAESQKVQALTAVKCSS